MKKIYTKPNMEIVSFNVTENITTEGTSTAITATSDLQTKANINTIKY